MKKGDRVKTMHAGVFVEGVILKVYECDKYMWSSVTRCIIALENGHEVDRIERSVIKI